MEPPDDIEISRKKPWPDQKVPERTFSPPWGEYERIFRKRRNPMMKINEDCTNVLLFASGFWISYFCATKRRCLAMRRSQKVRSGILWLGQRFLHDIFISFYGSIKMLWNRTKTKVMIHGIRYFYRWTLGKKMHIIDISPDCQEYSSPNVSVFTAYHPIQFCSPEKLLSIDNDSKGWNRWWLVEGSNFGS